MKHRNPLATPRIPQSEWDRSFKELEPIVCEDGTVLKRYQLINFGGAPIKDGPICTQVRMDQLIKCEMIERKPMKLPESLLFYADYTYGGLDGSTDRDE